MFNVTIGKYIPLNSKIHQMHVVGKIICLLLFLFLLFIDDIILLILLTILTILMIILSKVPIKLYLKSINSLKMLIIFLLVITLIFNGSWYHVIVSIVKIILGILYTMILTYTTSKSEMIYGLEKVFNPLKYIKLPIKQISLSITLALRFIPTIFEQANKIMKSQASRGIDFKHSNLKGKIIAVSSMMVPMFILTSKTSDAVADTMEVRMYDYNSKRSNYRIHKWHKIDENILLLHLVLLIYFIWRCILW